MCQFRVCYFSLLSKVFWKFSNIGSLFVFRLIGNISEFASSSGDMSTCHHKDFVTSCHFLGISLEYEPVGSKVVSPIL